MFLALGMEGLVAECFADRPPVFQKQLRCLADSYEWKDGRQFSWKEYFAGTELADYETNNATKAKFFNSTFKGSKVTTFTAYRDQIKQLYADRDPRMTATLITPYSDYLGWYKNAEAPSVLVLPVASIKDGNGYIRVNGGYNCYLWRKPIQLSLC